MELPQRQFQRGSRVNLPSGSLAAAGEPVIDATGEALVTLPDGKQEKVEVSQTMGRLGSFRETAGRRLQHRGSREPLTGRDGSAGSSWQTRTSNWTTAADAG